MDLKNNSNTPTTVLSYNISFQAMTHRATGSAWELGKNCTFIGNSKVTICAKHMAEMIDEIPTTMGVPAIDFVGLQEASRWILLQDIAPNTLGKMESIGSQEGRSEMASFYDATKYKLMDYRFGDFSRDRPYQILVFKNLFDDSGTIFINAHNPHHFSFDDMQHQLGAAAQGMYLSEEEKKYRIIVVGDFNETGWDWATGGMSQQSFTPLISAGISTSVSIGSPVFSCCKANGKWSDGHGGIVKGSRGGDYVFDSKSTANIQVPKAYDSAKLKSDHLPVMAVLS